MFKKSTLVLILTLILGISLIYQGIREPTILTSSPSSSLQILGEATPSAQLVSVTRVVDGDTLEVSISGGKKTVRLIGINTPETVDPRRPIQCFGNEASNETKRLALGRQVSLQKDVSETDKFGRLLRFVYIKLDDGNFLFLNDYLVRSGFAQVSTYPPDVKLVSRFKEAEAEAQAAKKGLWSACYY
ncbi:hypothetical protein A2631_02060 [Candidatus Daviesbacteria bacterium RIFCSPHIGHO2_01_FULL_44_29]|uniref:TNase-like domain-containing protein n=1 Tax=Candidatus Daviesbacteria bacterium RIFCSPHIGHO2_02_FULL_43_12 TaxID=1797776 RepID=A0A1F5KKN7_9BACT|nr:MAG: hypothetical protein A2631_02060 [Candidatus Daviesbacteria bacterium RIFCSPHIGHO2_01_FULL_44_29]OGE39543.1 MAG: hypothetical protein A3E86_01840 [Candidatus Daviesbacteria bacterium RIFCSPHIGHO2_12_FULL_47_45]OGE41181.1 MAG: hypothetical protein A3D25_01455 [Candidatus Daviesbacteria bacterium RIFCSPHIGHO2_02_FULL_43_12]OGE69380.1 MAG: hypothetical protein A3B55_03195 [Candidatus Daviesbacteria bacterium RIFCSPLOWO2_01_FULL_43_15]